MSENNSSTDINKYLFINLVTMLGITAMQQLGKIINPAVGKAAVNLEAAQATIDTLDMLSAKTDGKLDHDEARLLKDTLSALKMNYVETRDVEERKAGQKSEDRDQKSEVRDQRAEVGDQKSEVSGQKPEVSLSGEASAKTEDQQDIKQTDRQEDSKAQRAGDNKAKDPKFHKSYS